MQYAVKSELLWLLQRCRVWAPESHWRTPPGEGPSLTEPEGQGSWVAHLMSKRRSKAMKIPAGRKPGLDSGRGASTSAPGPGRNQHTTESPTRCSQSWSNRWGFLLTMPVASRNRFSAIGPRTARSQEFALAWHLRAPHCHTGRTYPSVHGVCLVPGTAGHRGQAEPLLSELSHRGMGCTCCSGRTSQCKATTVRGCFQCLGTV